jgi:hypothetical protein
MPEDKQWYSPKELFEMIDGLKAELRETTAAIKKYNSLREELNNLGNEQRHQAREIVVIQADDIKTRAIAEARSDTKTIIVDYLIKLWPLILMTIIFILSRL